MKFIILWVVFFIILYVIGGFINSIIYKLNYQRHIKITSNDLKPENHEERRRKHLLDVAMGRKKPFNGKKF